MSVPRNPALRALVPAAHAAALLLVLLPLADYAATVWPAHPGDFHWRYGATGLFSGFVLTPVLGLLLAALTAGLAGQRRVLAVLGWGGLAAALGLFLDLGLFGLDVLQVGPAVDAAARSTFLAGATKAGLKLLLSAGWLALLGAGALRAGRSLAQARAPLDASARGQVVFTARGRYQPARPGADAGAVEEAVAGV